MARKQTGDRTGELSRRLQAGGLDDRQVREMVDIVGGMIASDWRAKVFPKGIPAPDGVTVKVVLERDSLRTLIDDILGNGRVEGLRVFPLGIPFPEIFTAEIDIS